MVALTYFMTLLNWFLSPLFASTSSWMKLMIDSSFFKSGQHICITSSTSLPIIVRVWQRIKCVNSLFVWIFLWRFLGCFILKTRIFPLSSSQGMIYIIPKYTLIKSKIFLTYHRPIRGSHFASHPGGIPSDILKILNDKNDRGCW